MSRFFTILSIILLFISFGCDKTENKTPQKQEKVKIDKKIDYSNGKKTVSNDSVVSFWTPQDWEQMEDKEIWIEKISASSMNLQKDKNDMDLIKYSQLAIENIKKIYPSFSIISNEIKDSFGSQMMVISGELTIYGYQMRSYSLILDKNSIKYVLTIGCKRENFKTNRDIFLKIINSFSFE
ncbi:hypothetical protein JXR93_06810 [bacterium]|nr:hypothetical protein [bacterium]